MIIICEKCNTNYRINPKDFTAEGRSVKCMQCQHVWHAKLPPAPIEAPKTPVEPTSKWAKIFLPVVVDRKIPLWLKLASVAMSLITIGIGLIFYNNTIKHILPFTAGIYNKAGIFDTSGVVLEGLTLHKFGRDEDYDILVKGKVINKAEEDRYMPHIRFNVIDNHGKKIASYHILSDKSLLSPGEEFAIHNKLTHLTPDVAYINIDIGNKVDLTLR